MWSPCPVVLDEPVTILGIALEDFTILLVSPILFSFFVSTGLSFVGSATLAVLLRRLKRGKPPGGLVHGLHDLGLVRLPGVLPTTPTTYGPW